MSRAIEIKRGTFQLTRTVENPKPNRRNSRDWTCQPEWTGGTYFIIEDWYGSDRENPLASIRTQRRGGGDIVETDERFWLIARYLTPVEEKPSDYLARLSHADNCSDILDYLFDHGKLTLADVSHALEMLIEGWVAEDKAATERADAKRAAAAEEKAK